MADAISELNLGVRELFRILIPGLYVVALIEWLAPHPDLAAFAGAALHKRLIAAFFIGLLAYALQVHEKWFPFNRVFERWCVRLNDELGGGSDRVHEYKYFLETRAAALKDRIHYFSSFYYMLIELSLLSGLAALALLLQTFDALGCLTKPGALLLALALSVQLLALYFPRRPDRGKWLDRMLQYGPAVLLALGLSWTLGESLFVLKLSPSVPVTALGWRAPCLLVVALVFERLGSRHWESVIKEQIALVKERREDIRSLPRVDAEQ